MKRNGIHLTYCQNIHPGERWSENLEAIRCHVPALRDDVAAGEPFGIGLRLSDTASRELSDGTVRGAFRRFLEENRLYVFTVNAFPYGTFHGRRVKEGVYAPDWRTPERRDYTNRVVDILADLLPEGMTGSVSTVPGSYRRWIRTPDDAALLARRLQESIDHLAEIEDDTGKHLILGLEPEPDCFLETTEDVLRFFGDLSERAGADAAGRIARHLGVCFDTCHLALQFERLDESLNRLSAAGIPVAKVQVSAALATEDSDASRRALERFADPVYLHQVKARTKEGGVVSLGDLPEALTREPVEPGRAWRIHVHVPLDFERDGPLGSTASELTPAFFGGLRRAGVEHLEMETYTFDVLPEELRQNGVRESIRNEYRWLLDRLVP